LIVICLEAGLGINAAFLRVSNEMPNAILGRELRQTLNEMTAGIPLDKALRNLSTRAAIPEISGVVVSVIQAQKMGTALAQTFRVQAESLRETYRLKMKEHIMKVPIKILLPLVLFILPSIFVVILGPAFMTIMEQFSQS
jgi:tight adherence protein C